MSETSIDSRKFDIKYFLTLTSQVLQLGLLWYIVSLLQIEKDLWLDKFLFLVTGFFLIHAISPSKFKPIVFFFSFVSTIILFLGFGEAINLLLLGLGVLGICHLPTSMTFRRLLLIAVAVFLALARIGYVWSPLSAHGLTVFAAIFMFRTILYIYELKYEKTATSIWHRLNYFFMLPNIVFPLFPIVDYKTYLNTYYTKSSTIIYQRGINLIAWSIVCLVLYRWLYYFAVPDLDSVDGVEKVVQYIIATYLTVIRLVGILSLSVGVLRLFGYNLPEIFNYMFLASSFSDLFRRINIYWKGFLMKLSYYPAYFKLRKITPGYAIILSALVTFFFTWFFHIYQWGWILGSNPIRITSILYWGIFGILATLSMQLEMKKTKPDHSFLGSVKHAGKVMGVFFTMAILYSMWTHATLADWLSIVEVALHDDTLSWVRGIGLTIGAILLLGVGYFLYWKYQDLIKVDDGKPISAYFSIVSLFMLIFLYVNNNEDPRVKSFSLGEKLNENEATAAYEGYYEDILSIDVSSQLWDDQINSFLTDKEFDDTSIIRIVSKAWKAIKRFPKKKKNLNTRKGFESFDFVTSRDDVVLLQMLPNQVSTFRSRKFSTNEWGLRDKSYTKQRIPNTIRIAILGGSPTLGNGVHDEEVYEVLAEEMLNSRFENDSLHFEIMNFGLAGIQTFQLIHLLEQDVKSFNPDFVILVEHFVADRLLKNRINKVLSSKVPLPTSFSNMLKSIGVDPLEDNSPELTDESLHFIREWSLYQFSGKCLEMNVQPILMYFPSMIRKSATFEFDPPPGNWGFDLFDLSDVYSGYHPKSLFVSDQDHHPSPRAHQIIANGLYEELLKYLNLETK